MVVSTANRQIPASLPGQLATKHIPVPGEADSYYAFGLTTFKYHGLEFVGHGGFSRGYGSMIQMVPSSKVRRDRLDQQEW
mgnify:CR=1 FL=1